MKNMHRLIKLTALASACYVFFGMSLDLAVSLPDEKTIVNTIFAESEKNRDQRGTTQLESIEDFVYQKAKNFAALDNGFVFNYPTESVNIEDLIPLDDNNVLVVLQPDIADYQGPGFLFIINQHKNQWSPVELEEFLDRANEFIKNYWVETSNIKYAAPILSIYSSIVTNYGENGSYDTLGVKDYFLFKDGKFNLIRAIQMTLDEQKAKGIDFEDPNIDYKDFMEESVRYVDPEGEWRHFFEPKI